jgi:hypothetical protein
MATRSVVGVLAAVALAIAPAAEARSTAKFQVQSIKGSESFTHTIVYPSQRYAPTACTVEMTETMTFRSTKKQTAYAHTSKSHGSARVEWSAAPEFTQNLTTVEFPGEVTVERRAVYNETNYTDPEFGEVYRGCYDEENPVDCSVTKTVPATLEMGGTSDPNESTYATMFPKGGFGQFDDACWVYSIDPGGDDPGVFSRSELFRKSPKRLTDASHKERLIFDSPSDDVTHTGTIVSEISIELKRKKLKRK